MGVEQSEERGATLKVVQVSEQMEQFVQVTYGLLKRGRYLTNTAKWLYVTLRSFKNNRTGRTYPSYQKIMQRGGLTRNAVAKGLAELERFGYLVRDKSEGRRNQYIFTYPSIEDASGKEVSNQIYPTKEMAKEWALDQRQRKRI